MSTLMEIGEGLTPEQFALLAPKIREAVRDKGYQLLPLGEDVATYMRAKRQRQSPNTRKAYESSLDKLARHFADLTIEDFEPPLGVERLQEFLDTHWGGAAPATYNLHVRGRAGRARLLLDRVPGR